MRTTTIILTAVLLVALATSWVAAQSEDGQPGGLKKETEKQQTPAVNVKVEKITLGSLSEKIVLSGETKATVDVTYASEVAGRVEALKADLGQHIKKGAVLARIDYTSLKARQDQAQAAYQLASKTYERMLSLGQQNLAPMQQVDEARSGMQQSEAMLKIAKADLKKSIVRATVDGMIAGKYVEVGSFVAPGSPIFKVVDTHQIIIEAQVPERQIGKVSPGTAVEVTVGAIKHQVEGKVEVILPTAHDVSRTFTMRVRIDNPEGRILVGMAAHLSIEAYEHKQVVVTPFDTVIESDDGRSVFVLEDGLARKREVKLGASEGDRVMLAEGVKEGDELIVVGHRDLIDGQAVHVVIN